MSKQDTALRALVKELGENYSIRNIDGEQCPYRDFGNGFNVEISGMHTASMKKKATLYLWFGDSIGSCMIVRTVKDVPRADIAATVEELHAYSNSLLEQGYDNRDKLFHMKYPESRRVWNFAKGGINMMHKIFYGSMPKLTPADKAMFSRGKYVCMALLQKQDGQPVIISQCEDTEYPSWRVDYGFSSVFFTSYAEAMAFCKGRFMDLDGKAV